jgi:hypothetical protein
MRALTFVMACLLVATFVSSANAQIQTAQVDISCTPGEIFLESFPDSPNNTTIVNCVMNNPTSSEEKVELNGSGDDVLVIDFIDGNEFIIPAGGSVDANVSISVIGGSAYATYSLTFTASVTEVSGMPPVNSATDSVNILATVNQYESYVATYDSPLSFTVVLSDQTQNVWDAISVSNNGNYESIISLDVGDLNNDLGVYNLSSTVPVQTRLISGNTSDNFLLGVGVVDYAQLNTSTWELIGANGTKKVTLTSTIGLQSSANATCYECTTLLDVNIEIYAIQSLVEDSDSENEDAEDEQVSFIGFTGTLAVLTIAFAFSKREI